VKLYLIALEDDVKTTEVAALGMQLEAELLPDLRHSLAYRACGLSRLRTLVETGVDLDESRPVISVGVFSKAWEYGGWPKLMLAYRWSGLGRICKVARPDTTVEQIGELRSLYPHEFTIENKLHFSIFPREEFLTLGGGSLLSGRFFKQDPLNVLVHACVIDSSFPDLLPLVQGILSGTRNLPEWNRLSST
jgi:hypothetical protein